MSIIETKGEVIPEKGAADNGSRRRLSRSKLLLAGSIESAGMKSPVRIRDLSETGALLEGPAFPAVDSILTLTRLAVQIDARVVWHRPPKCGVEFQGQISIPEWISGKPGPVNFGQARVDGIQAAIRAGTPIPSDVSVADLPVDLHSLDDRIGTELTAMQGLLEAMSSELSGDPDVVHRHCAVLQNFDLVSQTLGHLTAILSADDRLTVIRAIGMAELRSRLLNEVVLRGI
jgi:hypothetical protein